jgi:acetyl-CoA acetyltransferase
VGESALGVVPNRSSHSLAAEAALNALADAGLTKADVDGLVTMPSFTEPRTRHALNFAQYLGLHSDRMQWISSSMHGSTVSSGVGIHEACMAVASGACECVLFVTADNLLSSGSGRDAGMTLLANNRDPEFENPYGTLIAGTFALIAQRYMHDYDVSEEDLALVTVALRQRANNQPKAHMYGKPVTVEDVLASPIIASPLRRLNCSLVSDGACAVVVTTQARARDLAQRAVVVEAGACVYGDAGGFVTDDLGQLPHLGTIRTGTKASSSRTLGSAGLTLGDVDVLATYDPFSFFPLMVFEGLGYCEPGEGGQLVRSGFLDHGVGRHWNTHGGLMAYCHPGTAGGLFMILEAVRQLRGQAVYAQASDPSVALIQGYGANKGTFPSTVLTVDR